MNKVQINNFDVIVAFPDHNHLYFDKHSVLLVYVGVFHTFINICSM